MGILAPFAQFIIGEHKYKPISGRVLTLGRQTIHLKPEVAIELMKNEKIFLNPSAKLSLDTKTKTGMDMGYISDASFFSLLGVKKIETLDVSPYQGADIIHDLCEPIPEELEEQFDFILNGSVLDNVFDPATAIKNISKMLKKGGRVIHFEHASNLNRPYLVFTPGWFMDYYALNGFADCKVYLALFEDMWNGPYDIYAWMPTEKKYQPYFRSAKDAFVFVIAEKGEESTANINPTQTQYRPEVEWLQYEKALSNMKNNVRPILDMRISSSTCPPGFNLIGSSGLF